MTEQNWKKIAEQSLQSITEQATQLWQKVSPVVNQTSASSKKAFNDLIQDFKNGSGQMGDKVSQILPDMQELQTQFSKFVEVLKTQGDQASDWVGQGGRYSDAIVQLGKIFIRWKLLERSIAKMNEEEKNSALQTYHQQTAEELVQLCQRQGGAWVKAAQLLSCHAGWLPAVYSEKFALLQDQAPAIPWEQIEQVLIAEWGVQYKIRLKMINATPLATASVGQVHLVQSVMGHQLAIKIQIPGAEQKIKEDLRFFALLAGFINQNNTFIDAEQVVRELSSMIMRELDYYHEAENLKLFSNHFPSVHWVYPQLVPELLSHRILTMQFIAGEPLRKYLEREPATAPVLMLELLKSFLLQIFKVGLFHADPHPGNFFVTPDKKIALLDFGAVERLTDQDRENYKTILFALLFQQPQAFQEALERADFKCDDWSKVTQALFKEQTQSNADLIKLQTYLEIMRQCKVSIPDAFILVVKVLVTIGGLLKKYQVQITHEQLLNLLIQI